MKKKTKIKVKEFLLIFCGVLFLISLIGWVASLLWLIESNYGFEAFDYMWGFLIGMFVFCGGMNLFCRYL